jgi:Zn-dependent peptidase ImmA (M78 family)/transcriptional regulator with XRE-family HTH domain
MDIPLRPDVLRWARERARLDVQTLAKKVGTSPARVASWESDGRIRPKQVEKLARATHTAVGLLYLPEPPVETLSVPDFRTLRDEEVRTPSPDLLDVIDQARQRQDWFRDYLVSTGEDLLDWVGSLTTSMPVRTAAEHVRRTMGLDTELRRSAGSWEEAVRLQIALIEEHGAMVMRSGIVGNDTHRALSVDEFRGFALADAYAPLVFVNATDTKGAQMFTLAHELMHIWLGVSGVSNLDKTFPPDGVIEQFCNEVAAELLVPADELRSAWAEVRTKDDPAAALTRRFKVSKIVILRRLRDLDIISVDAFLRQYREQQDFFRQQQEERGPGGHFYNTQRSRMGDRFARALVESALEGRTPYRDALRLLGISNVETFHRFARELRFTV